MISRKHLHDLLFLVIVSVAWFVIGWLVHGRVIAQNQENKLIERVRQTLLEDHVDGLPSSRELTYGALRGMIKQTDDPYAAFLDPFLAERFRADFSGKSGIIGLMPEKVDGDYVVKAILPDSPAEEAGLQVGDIIDSVDGVVLGPLTTSAEVILSFRGPVGTPTEVVIRRGDEMLTFAPVREVRPVVSKAQILDGNIAYFDHHTFTENSPDVVRAVLQDLLTQEPNGVIWDLRSNGGGSIEAAQAILSAFIEEGLLFQIRLKDGELRLVEASGDALAPEIPLVILTSRSTASAAEAVAASIHDYDRGLLIGDTTFGKGTVQTTMPMPEHTAVQFTIAHWLSPRGAWYDGRGIVPDIWMVDNPDTVQDEVLEVALVHLMNYNN